MKRVDFPAPAMFDDAGYKTMSTAYHSQPGWAIPGAPVESATGALAFYVLTLLDAKGRERVNNDLTQVGLGDPWGL